MSEHKARIFWKLGDGDFSDGRYSREHTWTFDGGITVPASPSPSVVRAPYSNPANVDPEEAYVAAISSCHMLTFLYLASRAGVVIESYEDDSVGVMTKNERGVPWISAVTLRPIVVYRDGPPPLKQEQELHHRAHLDCFISNSVKTEITVRLPREAAEAT